MRKSSFADLISNYSRSRTNSFDPIQQDDPQMPSQLQTRDVIIQSLRAELKRTQQYCKSLTDVNGRLRDELELCRKDKGQGDGGIEQGREHKRLQKEKADFQKSMKNLEEKMERAMEEVQGAGRSYREGIQKWRKQIEEKDQQINALKAQVGLLNQQLKSSQNLVSSELAPIRIQLANLRQNLPPSQSTYNSPSKLMGYQSMLTPSYSPRRYENSNSKIASEISALQAKVEQLQKRSGVLEQVTNRDSYRKGASHQSRNYSPSYYREENRSLIGGGGFGGRV